VDHEIDRPGGVAGAAVTMDVGGTERSTRLAASVARRWFSSPFHFRSLAGPLKRNHGSAGTIPRRLETFPCVVTPGMRMARTLGKKLKSGQDSAIVMAIDAQLPRSIAAVAR